MARQWSRVEVWFRVSYHTVGRGHLGQGPLGLGIVKEALWAGPDKGRVGSDAENLYVFNEGLVIVVGGF